MFQYGVWRIVHRSCWNTRAAFLTDLRFTSALLERTIQLTQICNIRCVYQQSCCKHVDTCTGRFILICSVKTLSRSIFKHVDTRRFIFICSVKTLSRSIFKHVDTGRFILICSVKTLSINIFITSTPRIWQIHVNQISTGLEITCIFQLVALVCLVGGMFVKYGSDDLKSLLPDLMTELVRKIDPILRGNRWFFSSKINRTCTCSILVF